MALELCHVGVAVANTAEVAALYEQALGLRRVHEEARPDPGLVLTFLAADDGRPTIELLEPMHEDTPVAKFLREHGPGLHHLCFRVQDIRAEMARLAALGFEPVEPEPRRASRGHLIAFLHPRSTHGVLIELCQHREAT